MTSERACFLCDREAKMGHALGNPDAVAVECAACGRYVISGTLSFTMSQPPVSSDRWRLSAVTRRTSDAGTVTLLTTDNVEALKASVPNAPDLPELIDRLLVYIASKAPSFMELFEIPETDYTLFALRSEDDLGAGLYWIEQTGYGDSYSNFAVRLNAHGWQRAREIRETLPTGTRAFVAMWFSEETKYLYADGIAPALRACGYTPVRVDLIEHNAKIDDRIIAEIRGASLLVGDFTGQRGGVYFELGYAMGRGTPVIWTCREDEIAKVHFDTRQYNHITWKTPEELKEKLVARIRATMPVFPEVTG